MITTGRLKILRKCALVLLEMPGLLLTQEGRQRIEAVGDTRSNLAPGDVFRVDRTAE